ncbi:plasmid partitioning protein RepB C-terminal domain-containing protein [Parasphingorhabdus sp.]|uniref:plasmid partitioning protein RepB C-terminal domain-containing protein n=1 Tax=Parasphingorhabdus sp. TaxID=2709688 RepID=UPI0030017C77
MSGVSNAQSIEWLPIDRVNIVNPRDRNQPIFKEIVDSIAKIGLKRPITVTRRTEADGEWFDLVCGQGRLEAYQALGHSLVPAMVVEADPEDCLIASLVENCARRHHKAIDLLKDIGAMQTRGNSLADIARKTGLSMEYVHGVTHLLNKGEQRLLQSVEARTIPLSVAIDIAEADDEGIQRALHEAYENGLLKGKKLLAAKRLIELRKRRGKCVEGSSNRASPRMTTAKLIKVYEEDVARKSALIKRARNAHDQLMLIVQSISRLSDDEGFLALAEDEDLYHLPSGITERMAQPERKNDAQGSIEA